MNSLAQRKADRLRRFFRANMLLELAVFAASVCLVIRAQCDRPFARREAEAVLNRFAIGGLLYIVAFW